MNSRIRIFSEVIRSLTLILLLVLSRMEGSTREGSDLRVGLGAGPIRAFCVDFNWGPGGPNGFARPGLWAQADPEQHVTWYKNLGCKVIQTFAVSCNGYAWYRGGSLPEQPGLKYNFLPRMVELGHAQGMLVFGYFCVGANTRWGKEHPDLSYGHPSAFHIPFTDEYLRHLSTSIEDALRKSGMDGFMIDWVWCPTEEVRKQANGGRWLAAEKKLFEQLLGRPFPGETQLNETERLEYERKAIDRCWAAIRNSAKRVNSSCIIWLSCSDIRAPAIAGTAMLREVDWVMDESGTPKAMQEVAPLFGPGARQLLCLAGWGDRHKTEEVLADPAMSTYGIYGFSPPAGESEFLPLPVSTYLSREVRSFQGNDRSIATLARFYNQLPLDFVETASGVDAAQPPAEQTMVVVGQKGSGLGKHIVFVSGDEEYRSEESFPMLAGLLAGRYGFKATVLFAVNKKSGEIDPNTLDNIPGLEALTTADLMVICTRFRELPDEQMKWIDFYLESGKPVVGIRPAVVAFRNKPGSAFFRYSSDNPGPEFAGGFGQQVLGSSWISHHGDHGRESSRGIPLPEKAHHPILRGVGTMWGPSDVYTIRTPIPHEGDILVIGQVVRGMRPNDPESQKSQMPLAWTKYYPSPGGAARVFVSTMGTSEDFLDENFRRMIVNACFWTLGLEDRIPEKTDVNFAFPFEPTRFGFNTFRKGLKPADLNAEANCSPTNLYNER